MSPRVLIALGALLPAALHAQSSLQFNVGGSAAQQIVQSHIDPANDRFTGMILGLDGALVSDRLVVRVHYGEGRISPKSSSGLEAREVVEGEALLGFRAVPWLTLWLGPSARAYTTPDGDQRWLIWSGRATARGTLLPGRMQTFVELWGALSGNVAEPQLKASGRGANGGLEVRFSEASAFWGRLGYRMESTHAQGMRETVESLTLSVFYGIPQ